MYKGKSRKKEQKTMDMNSHGHLHGTDEDKEDKEIIYKAVKSIPQGVNSVGCATMVMAVGRTEYRFTCIVELSVHIVSIL